MQHLPLAAHQATLLTDGVSQCFRYSVIFLVQRLLRQCNNKKHKFKGRKTKWDIEYESCVMQPLKTCQNIPSLWHNEFKSMWKSVYSYSYIGKAPGTVITYAHTQFHSLGTKRFQNLIQKHAVWCFHHRKVKYPLFVSNIHNHLAWHQTTIYFS